MTAQLAKFYGCAPPGIWAMTGSDLLWAVEQANAMVKQTDKSK